MEQYLLTVALCSLLYCTNVIDMTASLIFMNYHGPLSSSCHHMTQKSQRVVPH